MAGLFDGTYDPSTVDIIVGDITVVGLDPGVYVRATRNQDAFIHKKGADKRGARARVPDDSGEITLTLMTTSPSNDLLSALTQLDQDSGQGVVSVFVKDRTSKAGLCHAQNAWIKKHPDFERGLEIGQTPWILVCDDLEIVNSGLATAVGP